MAILKTEKLTKSFGAMIAVSEVDLDIEEGTLHAIIGPNGAGKTTFFKLISGEILPTSGHVFYKGKDITKNPSYEVAHLGIGWSFQKTSIFPKMTAWENVWLAVFSINKTSKGFFQKTKRQRYINREVERVMAKVGLTESLNKVAGELPHHEQRLLEVAIALATSPSLVLLDEATSGMAREEIPNMIKLIEELKNEYTIMMIEHNMEVVMSISDIISVMHFGVLIAQGSPEEIQRNEKVQQAYLGV